MTRIPKVALCAALVLTMLLPGATAASPTPPWDPFFAGPTVVSDFGATTRPFGIAAGDFDGDTDVDMVVGRTTGNVAFLAGNGDGTFALPVTFVWKQAFNNAWAFAPADLNGDGNLDVVWGANAPSTGCSVSPIPVGQTCATVGGTTVTVNDGEVRVFYGNGDGTFAENTYFVSGVRHNAGARLSDIGTDAGSLAAGDVDADGDADVVAGAVDGANSVVRLLRNDGGGTFTSSNLISQPTATSGDGASPTYFPAISTQNSPWGLSFADSDADGDLDLWVGDRALYIYLYRNDGLGAFTLQTPNSVLATRPNVYLRHDTFRAAVGFTPSLASGDINGDGNADLALGLQSGAQTPASATANDGSVLLNVSAGTGHTGFGSVADIGTVARGLAVVDVNGDGYLDIVGGEYDGDVTVLRQLPPIDSDGDGVSDYVDNAPEHANAARLDMNTDGSVNHRDQLDNDFDTVLGDPEDPTTWQRLGDPADADDDNDGVLDDVDSCPFVANAPQGDADGDAVGDACDPLDGRDPDGDGVPTGPLPGDPLYDDYLAAKIVWSQGDTHFVIRIDALGRIFQNEFTQLMADAAALSADEWATKCWENYGPGGDDPPDPCGTGEGTVDQTVTLPGGVGVPVTLVTIPKQLWTDAPVVDWINDRNDNPRFELGQHGTYHLSNTTSGDWAGLAERNFFSCEFCGLTLAENVELLRVGRDTLLGNYADRWVAQSGATETSARIDWSSSAHPLISYAPPFNADDPAGRQALAVLGLIAHSSSVFEEGEVGSIGAFFTPEGSHHEAFDQFGLFHVSADLELEPPDTTGDTYDSAEYEAYLQANTDDGGLTTWLIEEVEWSGRPCNNEDRLGTCSATGGSNRENNTVYLPRWEAWIQLLEFVRDYPGGVAMTMGEVAMAMAFDNAPTVANPDQADADHDGVGDVIDGVELAVGAESVSRNQPSTISATLTNGAGDPLADQAVELSFDADGDGTAEVYAATTDVDGLASASVTATRPVGPASVEASWDGLRGVTAAASGEVSVLDATQLALDAANPTSGKVTDEVEVAASLFDSDGAPLADRSVTFAIGEATASGTTDSAGRATATLVLAGPAGASTLSAAFEGDELHGPSSHEAAFTVELEDTALTLPNPVQGRTAAVAEATLREADGAPLAGKPVEFSVQVKERGALVWRSIGTATTDAAGTARLTVDRRYGNTPIQAVFAGDDSFLGSSAEAVIQRR